MITSESLKCSYKQHRPDFIDDRVHQWRSCVKWDQWSVKVTVYLDRHLGLIFNYGANREKANDASYLIGEEGKLVRRSGSHCKGQLGRISGKVAKWQFVFSKQLKTKKVQLRSGWPLVRAESDGRAKGKWCTVKSEMGCMASASVL